MEKGNTTKREVKSQLLHMVASTLSTYSEPGGLIASPHTLLLYPSLQRNNQ